MTGRGKGKAKGTKPNGRFSRGVVQVSVGRRIHRFLRKGNYAKRAGTRAPVYWAAVLEYLMISAEILQLADNAARDNKKTRIIPRHFHRRGDHTDGELNKFLAGDNIAPGGILPNIRAFLLRTKTEKKGQELKEKP